MSEFENNNAVELNESEMSGIAGGAFKRPAEKEGFIVYQIKKGDNKNLIIVGDYLYIRA